MITLTLGIRFTFFYGPLCSFIFHRSQYHTHVIHHIPKIPSESLLEILRKVPERLPDVIFDLFNLEIRLDAIVSRWFKILKRVFSDESNVRGVPEGAARSVVRHYYTNFGPWPADAIDLFHERNEVPDMLHDMTHIQKINRVSLQRHRVF